MDRARRASASGSRWTCPSATAPSGRAQALAEGASIEEIYRDAVAETARTYAPERVIDSARG